MDIPKQLSPSPSSSDMENLENLSITMDSANLRIPRANRESPSAFAIASEYKS